VAKTQQSRCHDPRAARRLIAEPSRQLRMHLDSPYPARTIHWPISRIQVWRNFFTWARKASARPASLVREAQVHREQRRGRFPSAMRVSPIACLPWLAASQAGLPRAPARCRACLRIHLEVLVVISAAGSTTATQQPGVTPIDSFSGTDLLQMLAPDAARSPAVDRAA